MKKIKSLAFVGVSFFFMFLCIGIDGMIDYREFPSFSWPVFSVAAGGMMLAVALPAFLMIALVMAGALRGKWHE